MHRLIEELESAYDNAPNMFSIRIHHGGIFHKYSSRRYVNGHVDIFDMVDIDLFIVLALNRMPSTSATIEYRFDKMLLLTWKDFSTPVKDSVCDSVTPRSMPQHDSSKLIDEFVITYTQLSVEPTANQVIDGVIRQLSCKEMELDVEADFRDIAEHVRVDEVVDGSGEEDVEQGNRQVVVEEISGEQVDYNVDGIDSAYETQYHVDYSKDAGADDNGDDDVDYDLLVDEENEIIEPDVDVHLFGIGKDVPFDIVGVTSLVLEDVLKRDDVDVIFDQVRVNPEIPVKVVQDQLQHDLELQASMRKAFKAKVKAEREVKGDHTLQYAMLRDYVVELQSTNPNTTIKIAVERNIDPSFSIRVFKRIYVCLGALKLRFRACRRELLGLDAESKSSWFWFLQCLGDDIDLQPNSTFTFISDNKRHGWMDKHTKDLFMEISSLQLLGLLKIVEPYQCIVQLHMEVLNGKIVRDGNNVEASGSAFRQAQQAKPVVGQNGSCSLDVGPVPNAYVQVLVML
ncbi:hypothetical protein Tco_0323787 [Tanacetum coccineum]